MKKIKVSDLKPGMVFDQPVYIDPNNVLVQAKQEIAGKDIERLIKWGILEVETNGQLMQDGSASEASAASPAPAAVSGGAATATAAPARPATGRLDPELKAIVEEYETVRKSKRSFRNMLTECGETLEANIQALLDNKPFDNQAVIRVAGRLVEELSSKNLLLILFHGVRLSASWQTYHSMHAAAYGVALAQLLKYSKPRLQELMFAMILMDAGMFRLPNHIREKAGELSESERATVKTHPLLGYQLLLKNGKVKASLATVALQHHEAFDGTGYPQGLRSGQIEEISRIASICDCYCAMIEKRPWRRAMLPYDAMKTMLSVQMHRFDPRLLRLFLGRISIYPLGSLVQLSDNRIGMVISCKPDKPLRPLLRLMRDEHGLPFGGLEFVDLIRQTDIYITRALSPATAGIDLESEI